MKYSLVLVLVMLHAGLFQSLANEITCSDFDACFIINEKESDALCNEVVASTKYAFDQVCLGRVTDGEVIRYLRQFGHHVNNVICVGFDRLARAKETWIMVHTDGQKIIDYEEI